MRQANSDLVAILCIALKIGRPTDSGITSRIGKKASRSESSWIDLYGAYQWTFALKASNTVTIDA
jgi:hypothetical protein